MSTTPEITPFTNEPFTDFSKEENVKAFQAALDKIEKKLPVVVRLWIDGEDGEGSGTFDSVDPGQTSRVVANCAKGSREDAVKAVVGAHKAFGEWAAKTPGERADVLFRAARAMRLHKHEFSAMMVYEVGKSWVEADGDTAEAIDFLEFYAREALRYGRKQPITPLPGEANELVYIPLGVGAVIPPWNFPLAILVGMTTAALVAGNTVVLKPSSDSPGIASMFLDLMKDAGVPPGVLQFVPGPGSEVGNTWVEHPMVRFISFTGSMEVGKDIYEKAAKVHEGQIWLKRVVAEMGGKDFILVDEDADVDSAAKGVHAAAFGFQGQKCSACSRLIVHEKVHDELVEKVVKLTEATKVGHPSDHHNFMGPVINEAALKKTLEYIEIGKQEGKLLAGGEKAEGEGHYLKPTIFGDIERSHRLFKEEIFAPVLGITKVSSFEEGIAAANDTIFGLTGAYYGKDEAKIAQAKRELHCGNLYINRKCTGALVGSQPFGGFNMSGTDSKAGGRDYLLLFLQAKTISRASR
ncbi:MAG: L-glutamate gamma-semialdehyde dehydrogenase [Planctomycetota bacterium]|nr:MAG: L-glutamate gamma-semialdehyde dehydrogenase [Planctomycetota bacterium]